MKLKFLISATVLGFRCIALAAGELPQRTAIFHLVDGGKAFVKTTEAQQKYYFEICPINYVNFHNPSEVSRFLNSNEILCQRINETVFPENDARTKFELSLAMQSELDKEMAQATKNSAASSATFKMIFAQVISVMTFVTVNTVAHAFSMYGYPALARQAASFGVAISAAAYVGAVLISDRVRSHQHRQTHPALTATLNALPDDGFYYVEVQLPEEISAQEAEAVIRKSIDRASRKVYSVLRLPVERKTPEISLNTGP